MPSIDNIEQSCIQVLVAFGSFDILTGRRTCSLLDANDGNFNGAFSGYIVMLRALNVYYVIYNIDQ